MKKLLLALSFVCTVAILPASQADAATWDTRHFGSVQEYGSQQHQVCGYAWTDADTFALFESGTFYQGYVTDPPPCGGFGEFGDLVAPGWLGAASSGYRDGSLLLTTSWSYNSADASHWNKYFQSLNDSGLQNWQTYAHHLWWALDANQYVGDDNFSPVLQV